MHNANCYTPVKDIGHTTYTLKMKEIHCYESLTNADYIVFFHQGDFHQCALGSNSLCITMWGGNEWPSTHNRLENLFRLQIASTFHYLCCKAGNNAEEYIFILACGGIVQWSLGSIGIWLLRKLGICYNIMDNRYKSIYD